jgi:hypothetical protein
MEAGDMTEKHRITIASGEIMMSAELFDNETGRAIGSILPITGSVSRWGDEIYFSIELDLPRAPDARDVVRAGELGYWPDGSSFCIFFGKTPASRGDEIRAASPVNIFGRIVGDPSTLGGVPDGAAITITASV